MPRQPSLDISPIRCRYADRTSERPHCQLTAVVRYGNIALCGDCAQRRSTLGKGHPPRPVPPRGQLDTIQWLATADEQLRKAHAELAAAVQRARTQGHTWTTIGAALHISRQAAQQRFRKDQHWKG
ncbi:MAG: hypothetical protein ABI232_10250 [Jatrophihabitantaceae bacterium]